MCISKRKLIFKMAALLINEDILRDYFDFDDDISEFEGFLDNEFDLYILEELSSSENEDSLSEFERENDDNWIENFRGVRVEFFIEDIGFVFLDDFDVVIVLAKDYFFLMFSEE